MDETVTIPAIAKPRRSAAVWRALLLFLPLLVGAAILYMRLDRGRELTGKELPVLGHVPEFALVNQDNASFGSEQLRGKIWIADFVFTTCPGPCPMMTSRMSELQKPLEETDVQLVSFSIDPATDTPAVLKEYATKAQAAPGRWSFLTGDRSAIFTLAQHGFKLPVAEDPEAKIPVHSTRFILVDRTGAIRGYYDALQPDAMTKLLADTTNLLRQEK